MREKRRESTVLVQPYIICEAGLQNSYYVAADQVLIFHHDKTDFVKTFDIFFKLYFVLNIEYPILLKSMMTFIESCICRITTIKSGKITSLNISLSNTSVEQASNDR